MSRSEIIPLINPTRAVTPKAQSRIGLIVGIIILAVIVLVLIVIVIVLLLRKRNTVTPQCTTSANCTGGKLCSNGTCVTCINPPPTPTPVTISYSALSNTATINWGTSSGASSYNVYRKLEDPSVGVNNHSQKENTTASTRTFTGLAEGTHYFVVTAVNDCGESQPSSPVLLAPSCSSLASTMAAPIVTQDTNDCAGPTNADIVNVSFPDESIPNGIYIVQGTGQKGAISPYLYIIQGNSWGPANGIHLGCGAVATNHTVMQITEVVNAELTVTGPVMTGNSFTMTWNAVAGAEMYVVFLVGVDTDGVPHFYGSFAGASDTALALQTNSGDNLVFGLVLGFRICNRSEVSPPTAYITAA